MSTGTLYGLASSFVAAIYGILTKQKLHCVGSSEWCARILTYYASMCLTSLCEPSVHSCVLAGVCLSALWCACVHSTCMHTRFCARFHLACFFVSSVNIAEPRFSDAPSALPALKAAICVQFDACRPVARRPGAPNGRVRRCEYMDYALHPATPPALSRCRLCPRSC